MRNSPGEDLAHGALLLRSMRQTVRRGRFPWARRQTVLSGRLFRYVRPQVRWLLPRHHGKLHLRPQQPVAPRLFCLQGKDRSLGFAVAVPWVRELLPKKWRLIGMFRWRYNLFCHPVSFLSSFTGQNVRWFFNYRL